MSTDRNPTAPKITFVTIEHPTDATKTQTATYLQPDPGADWQFVTVENGDSSRLVSRDITDAQGVATRSVSTIVHLRRGGVWQPVVADYQMEASTPIQSIETEIADLHAEADRLEESARYSDDRHSGYQTLRDRANTMQHVLDVLAATDDH